MPSGGNAALVQLLLVHTHSIHVHLLLVRKQLKRMARQVKQLDSEVHQAMAVMYAETGKILN